MITETYGEKQSATECLNCTSTDKRQGTQNTYPISIWCWDGCEESNTCRLWFWNGDHIVGVVQYRWVQVSLHWYLDLCCVLAVGVGRVVHNQCQLKGEKMQHCSSCLFLRPSLWVTSLIYFQGKEPVHVYAVSCKESCDFIILEYKTRNSLTFICLYVLGLYACLLAVLTDTLADIHIFWSSTATESQTFVTLMLSFTQANERNKSYFCTC